MKLPDDQENVINEESYAPKFHRPYDRALYGKTLTWNQCVRGFFEPGQAQCMHHQFPEINLSSFDSVYNHSDVIFDRIRLKPTPQGQKSSMPPNNPWPQARIDLFAEWKDISDSDKAKGVTPDTSIVDSLIMDPSETVMPDDKDYLDDDYVNIINEGSFAPKYYRKYEPDKYGKPLTWNQCIRGFFTKDQAEKYRKEFNLSSHQSVKANHEQVRNLVQKDLVGLYDQWVAAKFDVGEYPDTEYSETLIMRPPPPKTS